MKYFVFIKCPLYLEDHSEQDGDEDEEDEDGVCTGHPILATVVPDQGRVHLGVDRLVVELSDVGTREELNYPLHLPSEEDVEQRDGDPHFL